MIILEAMTMMEVSDYAGVDNAREKLR